MPQTKNSQSKKKTSGTRLVASPSRSPLLAIVIVAAVTVGGTYAVARSFAASPYSIPGTDLAQYPKLAAPSAPVASEQAPTKDASEDTVYAYTKTSNTDGVVDAYDAAPGETKHSLYQKLKSQNVPGLIDPDASTPSTMGNSSSPNSGTTIENAYLLVDPGGAGGSNCWTNGYAHGECWAWKNNGYAHPQIYFIDHTSSQWPVAAATYKWNQAHGIDSTYRWATCPSISGIHCVNVTNANYGHNGWMGHTVMYNSSGIMTRAYILLNTGYNGTLTNKARASAHTICHEEGHALGLNHNSYYTSCMYPDPDVNVGSTVPTSQDFSLLTTIYSIRR